MNAEQLLEHFERISEAPDAIKRLRRFILDLAVRGKLVEQDPSDEPAAELLKRIAAEKARLVKAGEIKAVKPYERRDSSNLKLPDGWLMVSLAEIVNRHLGGGTPSKSNLKYWDGPLLWASVKDVGKSKYLTTTIDRITVEGLENSSSNLITPGNLLVVTRMGLGKVSINTVPVAINQDLRALFMSSLMDIDYCYNLLLTHGFEGSGLTVKGIKIEELLNISFPLPPLAEQHRIVAKADELMSLCDQLEAAKAEREKCRDSLVAASLQRLNQPAEEEETFREYARFTFNNLPQITTRAAHIKQLRQTILNLAVRGKLVEQDPSDEPAGLLLGRLRLDKQLAFHAEGIRTRQAIAKVSREDMWFDFPHSWEHALFDDLFVIVSGVTKGQRVAATEANEAPYLRVANVQRGYLDLTVIKTITVKQSDVRRYGLRSGDILMTEGGDWDKLGRAAIWNEQIQSCIHQNHIFRVRPPSQDILPEWVTTYVNSRLGRAFFEEASKQTTNLASINMTQLRGFPIPLPPLAEQHRIVAKVDELMAICDQLEAQITVTEQDSRRFLESVLADALAPGIECNHH